MSRVRWYEPGDHACNPAERTGFMARLLAIVVLAAVAVAVSTPVSADAAADCFGEDIDRRIDGCTALIEQHDQSVADLSYAYSLRALAYSLKGKYATAIRDYDSAISLQP